MQETDILLKLEGMNKSFTSTKAIVDVSLEVKRGEVRGLIGENGSGKSTLASMVTGTFKRDSGEMFFEGEPYSPASMIDSKSHGISILVQEMGTINGLTVWENIFLGKEDLFSKGGYVNQKKMIEEAKKALEKIGASYIDPCEKVELYSFEDRKMIEVATALHNDPKLLIIDETTTALSQKGRERIYAIIKERKGQGKSVLFISHDLKELELVCDTVTILRDGYYIDTLQKEKITQDNMRTLMIGRELSGHYYREDKYGSHDDEVVFEVNNVSLGDKLNDINLKLYKSEILGIGGLTDSGMHELCKVMFGAMKPDTGEVILKKVNKKITSTAEAIRNKIAYLPKDRDQESLFIGANIMDNIVLPSLDNLKNRGLISRKSEKQLAEENAERLNVKMQDINQLVKELSGGNKQKVVVAKWMANDSEVLIMDCPTRGIDVGVKANIYALMEELKKSGKSIIMVSEEMPELLGMSDRVVVLKDGRITAEFDRSEALTENAIIQKMI